ncbi:MAG: [protein-PII] uridylyltransferase [Nitrospirota bacterium]
MADQPTNTLKAVREKKLLEIKSRLENGILDATLSVFSPRPTFESLTRLADEIVEALYQAQLNAASSSDRSQILEGLAIVALAGYGRSELSPYSDLDIMFLYKPSCQVAAQEASKVILHRLWDIGFSVGHSMRTIDDCLALSQSDPIVRTSLLEHRLITGSGALFKRFSFRFHYSIALFWSTKSYIVSKIKERQEECGKYGTTVYLLEPNVKYSPGGLRDIHLIRWLLSCWHQSASFKKLSASHFLSDADSKSLASAQDFLWQIRNDLHFGANQSQDVLTFDEQIRLALRYQFCDKPYRLGVEQFMSKYYDHTTAIRDITLPILEQMTPKPFGSSLKHFFKRPIVEGDFQWTEGEISIREAAVLSDLAALLKLFHLAQIHHLKLSSETRTQIKGEMEKPFSLSAPSKIGLPEKSDAPAIFLAILGRAGQVTAILREMHRLRLLEQIIPAFSKARALMQFNAYHQYTVDEHSFRAVEAAEQLLDSNTREGEVYREIQQKEILHLALLLHDIGKGQEGDHSEVGVYIASVTADYLGLKTEEKSLLLFLVKQHLLMTHLAFRRDLSDPETIIPFVNTVGTAQTLKMLYILTLSDVAAVGVEVLTDWKRALLWELFEKTRLMLTGEYAIGSDPKMRVLKIKEALLLESRVSDRQWVKDQLDFIPARFYLSVSYEKMLEHLEAVYALSSESVRVTGEQDASHKMTAYTVYAMETQTEAIFSKISGVMAAKGLQILGATIITWENQVVVDTFWVEDRDYAVGPNPERIEDVSRAISDVLLGHVQVEALLIHGRRRPRVATIRRVPTQVVIDNLSSETFTILEVFADDRQGLLYFIAKAICEASLSVHTAKITTELNQIVDVFYVTQINGGKIIVPTEVEQIKAHLIGTIDRFLEYSRVQTMPPVLPFSEGGTDHG